MTGVRIFQHKDKPIIVTVFETNTQRLVHSIEQLESKVRSKRHQWTRGLEESSPDLMESIKSKLGLNLKDDFTEFGLYIEGQDVKKLEEMGPAMSIEDIVKLENAETRINTFLTEYDTSFIQSSKRYVMLTLKREFEKHEQRILKIENEARITSGRLNNRFYARNEAYRELAKFMMRNYRKEFQLIGLRGIYMIDIHETALKYALMALGPRIYNKHNQRTPSEVDFEKAYAREFAMILYYKW